MAKVNAYAMKTPEQREKEAEAKEHRRWLAKVKADPDKGLPTNLLEKHGFKVGNKIEM